MLFRSDERPCFHACSMGLTRMINLHLICDIPPIWEHTGARVILGEDIDGLLNTLGSEQGRGEWTHSPHSKFAGGSRNTHLCVMSGVGTNADWFTDRVLARKTWWCSVSRLRSGFRRNFLLYSGNSESRSYPPHLGLLRTSIMSFA